MDVTGTLIKATHYCIVQFTNPGERLFVGYLGAALLLAAIAYSGSKEQRAGIGFLGYVFPRRVWLHRSALLDYVYVPLTAVIWAAFFTPYFLKSATVTQGFTELIGAPFDTAQAPAYLVVVLYTVTLILAEDFRRYFIHRLFHRFPALWEFHKVHHSAQVLTPITLYREHPVEKLVNASAGVLVVGVVTGVFLLWFPGGLTPLTIFGANAGRFVFDLLGSNLRHSHIWLRFGNVVEHMLISPAQHQIHHSCDRRHFDRNFGSQLAVWDWAFGTLYVPKGREELEFGLGAAENERLSSLVSLYITPFRQAWRVLSSRRSDAATATGA